MLTGVRPVKDIPDSLNRFDLERKWVLFSDKEEGRLHYDGRLIPLCDFLCEALSNYITFLNKFAPKHNLFNKTNKFPIEDVMNGKRPLFLLWNDGFHNIAPKDISDTIKEKFNVTLQDNWLRHQLISTLLRQGTPEILVNALTAHEHQNHEAMHPLSSFSIKKLSSLANNIQKVANTLKLQQCEITI